MLMQRKAQSKGFDAHSLISGRQKRGESLTLHSEQDQVTVTSVDCPGQTSLLCIHLMRIFCASPRLPVTVCSCKGTHSR